jgi:hypothetical protein
VNDDPTALKILDLRSEIAELGGAIRQLQRSGLDSAQAQLLITRKRGELEGLMNPKMGEKAGRNLGSQPVFNENPID